MSNIAQPVIAGTTGAARIVAFAEGSRIRAAGGELPVEALTPGDLVVAVRRGGFAPVRTVCRQSVALHDMDRAWEAAPVRIRAHAFGPERPGRDLFLSPDLGVFMDGALFRARDLLNGTTIVQPDIAAVTYYRVALDRHDVLIADGLPAESLHHSDADCCAPLVWRGPKLAAARLALAARAEKLGFGTATEPADGPAVAELLYLQSAVEA